MAGRSVSIICWAPSLVPFGRSTILHPVDGAMKFKDLKDWVGVDVVRMWLRVTEGLESPVEKEIVVESHKTNGFG
jgi:hypothetical protein